MDTGAYPSVVDQKIAHDLGLAEQPGRVNLSNKSVQTRLVVLPSLTLGPVRAESLPVLTEDLSFLTEGSRLTRWMRLSVWMSSGKAVLAIDYRTREMLFGAIEKMAFSAPFDNRNAGCDHCEQNSKARTCAWWSIPEART